MNNAPLTAFRAWWRGLAARECVMLLLGAAVLALALAWSLAIAPAVRVWRHAPQDNARVDAALQHMLALQGEARTLQPLPRISRAAAVQQLQKTTQAQLGAAATVELLADQARVSLRNAPAQQVGLWLQALGDSARLRPASVQISRTPADGSPAAWSGVLVFALPPA